MVTPPHDKIIADAWNEYRVQTRNLVGAKYERVEPYLWASLQAKLGKLKVKRTDRVRVRA